ncbi:MAG: Bax inhibitor-1/YccA family protein [Gammaproteobacteria bacterium]
MNNLDQVVARPAGSVLATNKVIRNTYILLSMTLLFSAILATAAVVTNAQIVNPWLTLGGYFVLLLITNATRNSPWGIVSVFALTGFLGYTIGPIINLYMTTFSNGGELVAYALGATGVIFLGLSGYALTTRKDFSFMGGFLMAGILVAFIAGIAAFVFAWPGVQLAVSSMFVLLMAGLILYETSNIIHGGETNYIMATVTLYVALYNLFLSLLQLLAAFSGNNR